MVGRRHDRAVCERVEEEERGGREEEGRRPRNPRRGEEGRGGGEERRGGGRDGSGSSAASPVHATAAAASVSRPQLQLGPQDTSEQNPLLLHALCSQLVHQLAYSVVVVLPYNCFIHRAFIIFI